MEEEIKKDDPQVEIKEEEKKEEKQLSKEEINNWITFLKTRKENLLHVVASRRVKSVSRAMKRNRITPQGNLAARHPFNNRANTSSRKGVHSRVSNENKKQLYGAFKRFAAKQSV